MAQPLTSISADQIDAQFSESTNLASSALNAKVLSCSDDYFASVNNLINPAAPIHRPGVFVHTGAWYDGWETRRHNPAEYDWAVIKLGVSAGAVEGVEIDTAFFTGNYGEKVVVEAAYVPTPSEQADAEIAKEGYAGWTTVLPAQPCGPSQRQAWKLPKASNPVSHVRVRMYPDGGFARFRLYGHVIPPPAPVASAAGQSLEELSSALLGGISLGASDQHFSPASNLILPGRGKDMGDGWETFRSRTPGHVDWAIFKLGLPGSVAKIVVDTKDFRGNFPRAVKVHGFLRDQDAGPQGPAHDHPGWVELTAGEQACKADTEHVFDGQKLALATEDVRVFSHVKLTLIPDGGVKRLRIFGKRA